MKVQFYKFLLNAVGKRLPLRRHPFGKIANKIRCHYAKMIVKSIGKNCIIKPGAEIMEDCIIGDCTGIGPNCLIGKGNIFKGNSMMGPDVHIYTQGHIYDQEKHSFKGRTEVKIVTIGQNVWLGYGVIILPGVQIGDSVIIGAGSVVTKNIPSGVMAAGNPCIVKKILDKEIYDSANANLKHFVEK